MISDLVELLDRQHAFMRMQGEVDLLRHLPRYVDTLSRDARITTALAELTQEAIDELGLINAERREIADAAARLLNSYIELFPGEDDRGSEHDAKFEQNFGRDYRRSIRQLEKLLATPALQVPDFRERDSDHDPLEEALSKLWHRLPDRSDEGFNARVDELGTLIGNQQRKSPS